MAWIFISPHYDDVAFSCGGLLWELSQAGHAVEICTVCSGMPPDGPLSPFAESLHARWETGAGPVTARREEDQAACAALGAGWRYIDVPDCIYRPGGKTGEFYYAAEESLFGELNPNEALLVAGVAEKINASLSPGDQVVAPLTLGGHVDHRLARRAAELLDRPLLYYADYPYRLQASSQVTALAVSGWKPRLFSVSRLGLDAWQAAVAAYASQISTFWPGLEAMRAALHSLWESDERAALLWEPPNSYKQIRQSLQR